MLDQQSKEKNLGTLELGLFKPHDKCIEEHCTTQKGKICITDAMQDYLRRHHKLYHSKKIPSLEHKSDWDHLEAALKEPEDVRNTQILRELAGRGTHRLRYHSHGIVGKAFINALIAHGHDLLPSPDLSITNHRPLFSKTNSNIFGNFGRYFKKLWEQTERSSTAGIYRLFDLCSRYNCFDGINKNVKISVSNLKASDVASLIFAFNDSLSFNKMPDTISEFTGRFEFFRKFYDDAVAHFDQFDRTAKETQREATRYCFSEQGLIQAETLWQSYLDAARQIFSFKQERGGSPKNNFSNITEESSEFSDRLRKALCSPINIQATKMGPRFFTPKGPAQHPAPLSTLSKQRHPTFFTHRNESPNALSTNRGAAVNKLPMTFLSPIEAAYHPYKHRNENARFSRKDILSPFDIGNGPMDYALYAQSSMKDYLEMIKDIILTGALPTSRPDQFDTGAIYTFEKKMGSNTYQVIAKCIPGQLTYVLTCF